VIPTRVFHDAKPFQGLCRDVERYQSHILDVRNFSFMPRARAEGDVNFKQLIPYAVLKYRDQVFQYTRGQGAGEKRLRANRSIGIGGHINPVDHASNEHPYRQGLLREIAEEVLLESAYQEKCIGFINDDSSPVGQVHLGIVHLFELAEPRVSRREADVMNAGFAPIAELVHANDEFETWSQFVLAELASLG
jgi:predicted NUDIX family phosphoesterase